MKENRECTWNQGAWWGCDAGLVTRVVMGAVMGVVMVVSDGVSDGLVMGLVVASCGVFSMQGSP